MKQLTRLQNTSSNFIKWFGNYFCKDQLLKRQDRSSTRTTCFRLDTSGFSVPGFICKDRFDILTTGLNPS